MVAANLAAHTTGLFFEAHRTLRGIYGDRFEEEIRPACERLRRAAAINGETVVSAALRMLNDRNDRGEFTSRGRLHLLAAAIELTRLAELTAGEEG